MRFIISMRWAKSLHYQAKIQMFDVKKRSKRITRISQFSNQYFRPRFYKYIHIRPTYMTSPINFKRQYAITFRRKPHQDIVYTPMHDMKDLYYTKAGIKTTILYNY